MIVSVNGGATMTKSKYVMNKVTKSFGEPRQIDIT